MVNVNELMIGDYVDVGADGCPPAVAVVEEIYGKAMKLTFVLKIVMEFLPETRFRLLR